MSNSTTTNHLTDETMQLVKEVLNDFRNGPAKEEIDRVAAFLNVANDNPENVMDAYLTYFTGDPAEGRAFIVKYGVNGNHEQMREFVQSRLATKE